MKNISTMKIFKNIQTFFKMILTHNRCDTCGFTKDKTFVTEHYMESGLVQCQKCIDEK